MASTSRDPPPIRFTLAGLFELIAGIAVFLALVTQLQMFGVVCALVGFLLILAARHVLFAKDRREAIRDVENLLKPLVIVSAIGLFLSLLLPTVGSREIHETPCQRNLRSLRTAFDMYHEKHGHYPPPFVADANGKPMHSWRALILPYLDEELEKAYDMNEPWDSPRNRQLVSRMPEVFRCPSDKRMPLGMTSYFCVIGPGRLKQGAIWQKTTDFTDQSTILLIESNTARVNWLEPRDLTVDEVLARREVAIAAGAPPCHQGDEDGGAWRLGPYFNCSMHDHWHSRSFGDGIEPLTLKSLLTIDGGEVVDVFELRPRKHLWIGVWVLLGAEAAFVAFAIVRRVRIGREMRRGASSPCPLP
jgi:Protein of unknown function (DUF1559)